MCTDYLIKTSISDVTMKIIYYTSTHLHLYYLLTFSQFTSKKFI
jgi:hypothetical protein